MADRDYVIRYSTDNVSNCIRDLNNLRTAVDAVDLSSARATKGLKEVGKATSAMTRTDTKVKALATDLDAVTVSAGKATTALQNVGANIQGLPKHIGGASSSVDTFIRSLAGIVAANRAFDLFLDATKDVEKRYNEMSTAAAKYRDTLREIAFIQEKNGPNNQVMADVLDLALRSGMTPAQGRGYAQSYENIGPTVRARNVFGKDGTPQAAKMEKDVLAEAGRAAVRMGVEGTAAGEAVGIMASLGGFSSVEGAMDQFGNAMEGLSAGKIADPTLGVRALNKAVAKLVDPADAAAEGASGGRGGSYGEAGIYMGALTLGTGTADQASHRMVQISRLLNPVDPAKKQVLAAAGVPEEATDARKLIAFSEFLKTQKDPLSWMAENGLGTEATREAVVAGSKTADVLKQRLDKAAQGGAGARLIAANEKFKRTDRTAALTSAQAQSEALDIAQGAKYEDFETAKQHALNRMKASGNDPGLSWLGMAQDVFATPLTYAGAGVSARNLRLETDKEAGAIPILRQQAKKLGIDLDEEFPDIRSFTYGTRAEAFGKATKRIREAGGDPFGDATINTPLTNAKLDELRKSDDPGNGVNVKVDDAGLKDAAGALKDAAGALKQAAGNNGQGANGGVGRPPGANNGGAVRAGR